MSDTVAALAADCLDTVVSVGGPHVLMALIDAGDPDALDYANAIDERAAALGATLADVIAALRAEGRRRGMLPTVH